MRSFLCLFVFVFVFFFFLHFVFFPAFPLSSLPLLMLCYLSLDTFAKGFKALLLGLSVMGQLLTVQGPAQWTV